jgi:pyruvate dehydrogenase E2 component (dihydrolipoamide acetyltransferase)
MISFRMPSLGADMDAGTLVEWLAKPGDKVKRGDIIAVVETQKGAIEIEVFETGVLDQLLVQPGTKVPVGVPLAVIRDEGEAPLPAAVAPIAETPITAAPAQAPEAAAPEQPCPPPAPHVRASPAARRLAAERGVDLHRLVGTGPGGAIQLADVEAAAAAAAAPARPGGFDFTQMRSAIAAAMARSKREIPHYYLRDTVDLQPASDWLARGNAERPPEQRLLMGALFAKATALAARAFPEFNGHFEDGAYRPSAAVHIGVAITIRGGGLVAPAVHDAADLSLEALMAAMRDLVRRVRAGRFRSSEIADPTLTVSSLGDRGVEALFGIIYPPQVAIVGFGKPAHRPWVVDGSFAARTIVTITLAADHRVSDGHRGALFVAEIGRRLQTPEAL